MDFSQHSVQRFWDLLIFGIYHSTKCSGWDTSLSLRSIQAVCRVLISACFWISHSAECSAFGMISITGSLTAQGAYAFQLSFSFGTPMAQSAAPIGDSLVNGPDWSVDFSQREVQRLWYQGMVGALTVVFAEPIYSWTLHSAVC